MKKLIVLFLVFLLEESYAQTAVYTFNNGKFMNESAVRSAFETITASLPSSVSLVPLVYHRSFKKDTVINYIAFSSEKKSASEKAAAFEIVFRQDSTFLLLDEKLPYFSLKELNGQQMSSDQFSGKPALINFWATYCGPCIAEMPYLSKVKDKYKDRMNFISITENTAIEDNLKSFLANKTFNFPVLENGQAYKNKLKMGSLPKNLFIDKNGVVRFILGNYPERANSGALAMDDEANYFTAVIEELIKEN